MWQRLTCHGVIHSSTPNNRSADTFGVFTMTKPTVVVFSANTKNQFAKAIPLAFSALDLLDKAKAKVESVSWVAVADSLRADGFHSGSFKPSEDKKTENPARSGVRILIEGNYPKASQELIAKDTKTLNESQKNKRRALTQRWTALLAKITDAMAKAEGKEADAKDDAKDDDKSDDEKALIMIKALIGHLTAEGKTWKVVRRDDAVRSLKIAQAAIEGVKLATSK
jgi:hypothetical protein